MSNNPERLNLIFDLMAQGKTLEEIDEILERHLQEQRHKKEEQRHKMEEQMHERGKESELIAISILINLEIVTSLQEFKKSSFQDSEGEDLEVHISEENFHTLFGRDPVIKRVWVQVKSSRTGVRKFRQRYGSTKGEITQRLAEKRLVVINAQDGTDKVAKSFMRQVYEIDTYWNKSSRAPT